VLTEEASRRLGIFGQLARDACRPIMFDNGYNASDNQKGTK
jgi:hypothetical protein